MTTATRAYTFRQLKEQQPDIYRKINNSLSCAEYKFNNVHKPNWDFNWSINCWRFDGFLTDSQWATFARLCIRFSADISQTIREWSFETDRVDVFNPGAREDDESAEIYTYYYPTNIKGWIGGIFFVIEPDGRSHT